MVLRFPPARVLVLATVLLIGSAPPARAAWPNNPISNVPVCTATGDQWDPVACSDGAGGAIIAWYDWRSGNADVYAQRFNSSGVPQWTAGGVLVCGATGDQTNVRILGDGTSGTYIVWQDGRGTQPSIVGQRVNASGVPQWAADGLGLASHLVSVGQTSPAVGSDGDGGLIVVWQHSSGTNANIFGQHLDRSGTLLWGSFGLALCNAATAQQAPVVVSDGTRGGGIVVWQDARNGNQDIYAQRVNGAGTVQWTANGLAVCSSAGDQQAPAAVYDDASGAIISWTDLTSGNRDLYAQRINSSGATQWTGAGVVVCNATGDQWNGGILPDGASGADFCWFD
jgi:hypothetical protein